MSATTPESNCRSNQQNHEAAHADERTDQRQHPGADIRAATVVAGAVVEKKGRPQHHEPEDGYCQARDGKSHICAAAALRRGGSG